MGQKKYRALMKQYNVRSSFERLALQISGPYSEHGNKNILAAMDYFTKWVQACAISCQEATNVLITEFISRSEVPPEL